MTNTKKSTKNKISSNSSSSFWMDTEMFNAKNDDYITAEEKNRTSLLRMVQIKRAISNFIKIVTGNDYPVKFASQNVNYTDGKEVVISSSVIKEKEFDAAVGLALHEASHIKLSDFNILKEIDKYIPSYILEKATELDIAKGTNQEVKKILNRVKTIFGWIEDRRIDFYIYKTAPGYRGYYKAMYKKYFEDPMISVALKSKNFRKENWESYIFHIINFTNENRDLNALKELRRIYEILDLKNIERLKNSLDSLNLAVEIYSIIDKAITSDLDIKDENNQNNNDDDDGDESNDNDNSELNSKQIENIKKILEKQVKFINGEVEKSKISFKKNRMIEVINKAKTDLEEVGKDYSKINKGIDCVIIKDITQELIEVNPFGCFVSDKFYASKYDMNIKAVEDGIRLGIMLGKKLQIRNEERTTQYTRLKKGKIDKRLVNSIGYGAEQIFSQVKIDRFNPVHIHISIDASGSMSGQKWRNTMTAVVAICKAASMVPNNSLTVSVDFRATTHNSFEMHNLNYNPLLLLAYDSRKDKFAKVRKIFPHITCLGNTPEGLCFEAIMKYIKEDKKTEQYFINFSDGEPYFETKDFIYAKDYAVEHTAKQVKLMRDKGIKILSFFIHEYNESDNEFKNNSTASILLRNFQKMYGQSAKRIKVTDLISLAKSINEMFTK